MRKYSSFQHKSAAIFLSLSLVLFNSVSFATPDAPQNLNQPQDSPLALSIPETFGRIEESFAGNPNKTIVYIQDAHDSLEAQENISKIIHYFVEHYFVEHYGVKTVYEEGYEGLVPTDVQFFFNETKLRNFESHWFCDFSSIFSCFPKFAA